MPPRPPVPHPPVAGKAPMPPRPPMKAPAPHAAAPILKAPVPPRVPTARPTQSSIAERMAAQYAQTAPAPTPKEQASIYDYEPPAAQEEEAYAEPVVESAYQAPAARAPKPKKAGSDIVVPKRILRAVRKEKNAVKKFFLFYWYLRRWAEEQESQGKRFPTFCVDRSNYGRVQYEDLGAYTRDAMKDIQSILPALPHAARLFSDKGNAADLIVRENERLRGRRLSVEDEIGLTLLYVKFSAGILEDKAVTALADEEDEEEIQEVLQERDDERARQKRFSDAIAKKGFPVDAERLIRNYFNFMKKDPQKAYDLLITSPFYFSPIIPEKYNGNVTPSIAKDLNKKLGSFLKGLKA
jgi:hypothetical protein